ncbi:MAG: Uma2 family endonuclease [Chloroflexota bacterium]|nr:Uma2 family endonuclease [Chloroflexota bacterium]MDE2777539.1 Uma2 family endonuclease [Chloroflexota bacterium]
MAIQENLYTVDDLWAMESDPALEHHKYYLIDGVLYEDEMPKRPHARLQVRIGHFLYEYEVRFGLGEVTTECGFHPPTTRHTALLPDVAFQRFDQLPDPPPEGYVPTMPDLAVEIQSPSDTMSKLWQKARAYLEHGTIIVWLVQPERQSVVVCRLGEDGAIHSELKRQGDLLGGYDCMPGFELALNKLFPPESS